jgi:hypothetical protein
MELDITANEGDVESDIQDLGISQGCSWVAAYDVFGILYLGKMG